MGGCLNFLLVKVINFPEVAIGVERATHGTAKIAYWQDPLGSVSWDRFGRKVQLEHVMQM